MLPNRLWIAAAALILTSACALAAVGEPEIAKNGSILGQNIVDLPPYVPEYLNLPGAPAETPEQVAIGKHCDLGHYFAAPAGSTTYVLDEINYTCGEDTGNTGPSNGPLQVYKAGNPDTSNGTSLAVRNMILDNDLIALQIYALYCNIQNVTEFQELTKHAASLGYTLRGGYIGNATFIEQFYKPTPLDSAAADLDSTPKTFALGSDTSVYVAQLNLPELATTALFLFHGVFTANWCNWSTGLNWSQKPYQAPAGLPACEGCMAHEGFMAAFNTISNASDPSSSMLATWEALSGVPASQVTAVYCGGHSLGAALAVLCGAWAKATFPNAKIYAYLGGSPQVFNPAGAQWYNDVVGVSNVYRVINNKDIVPDGPPDVIVSYDTGEVQVYAQQGAPLWLYREGMHLPGNYTAFAMDQPHDYSMSIPDHLHGYILGLIQVTACNY